MTGQAESIKRSFADVDAALMGGVVEKVKRAKVPTVKTEEEVFAADCKKYIKETENIIKDIDKWCAMGTGKDHLPLEGLFPAI